MARGGTSGTEPRTVRPMTDRRGEPFGEGGDRIERIAERGDGTADAEDQCAEQTGEEEPAHVAGRLPAQTFAPGGPPRCQRYAGDQQKSVDQVNGEDDNPGCRFILRSFFVEDQAGTESSFGKNKKRGEEGAGADEMFSREGAERPRRGDQGSACRRAMVLLEPVCEFDDGGERWRHAGPRPRCKAASGCRSPPPNRWRARRPPI